MRDYIASSADPGGVMKLESFHYSTFEAMTSLKIPLLKEAI